MLIITAPGQGAQTPGFLSPWLELPGVTELLGTWSGLAKCDLITAGTTAGADQIRDTAVAQPLLVAAGLVAAAALDDGDPAKLPADVVAGHSVGELTAGVIAGVIGAEDAMRLVGVRGAAMAAATQAAPTGMTAVLGGDEQDVLAAIAKHGLTPANINGAGQIVAAGTIDRLSAFAADPPAGARLRRLQVAGAFHTSHMAPAVTALHEAASGIVAGNPVCVLLSNADGAAVATGKDWLDRVIGQVAAPVRWDACTATMKALGVTAMIELPPAGTLTGQHRDRCPACLVGPQSRPDQPALAGAVRCPPNTPTMVRTARSAPTRPTMIAPVAAALAQPGVLPLRIFGQSSAPAPNSTATAANTSAHQAWVCQALAYKFSSC